MSKISPCLWFNGDAEEAAEFYVSLLPDSRIEKVQRNITDSISGKVGTVLVVRLKEDEKQAPKQLIVRVIHQKAQARRKWLIGCLFPALFIIVIGPGAISIMHSFTHH